MKQASSHKAVRSGLTTLTVGLIVALSPSAASAAPQTEIDKRYSSDPALANLLGPATGTEFGVAGGSQREYKWGTLYYSSATGVHEVHGNINWRYKTLGGPKGTLKFPTTDEAPLAYNSYTAGAFNYFQGGELLWNKETNKTFSFGSGTAAAYSNGFPYLGLPVADDAITVKGATTKTMSNGVRLFGTTKGSFYIWEGANPAGGIGHLAAFNRNGGEKGFLGLPTSNDTIVPATSKHIVGRIQTFDGGAIYQEGYTLYNDSTIGAAYSIRGAIKYYFDHTGGLDKYGYPTSDEGDAVGGRVSHFQHGDIYWNAATNKVSYVAK